MSAFIDYTFMLFYVNKKESWFWGWSDLFDFMCFLLNNLIEFALFSSFLLSCLSGCSETASLLLYQIKQIWTRGRNWGVLYSVCAQPFQWETWDPPSIFFHCENWGKQAAVLCLVQLRCQILALALTCSKSQNGSLVCWATVPSQRGAMLTLQAAVFPLNECVWQQQTYIFYRLECKKKLRRMPSGVTGECLLCLTIETN